MQNYAVAYLVEKLGSFVAGVSPLLIIVLILGSTVTADTIVDDHFDDGDVATNTTGIGTGWDTFGSGAIHESGTELTFNVDDTSRVNAATHESFDANDNVGVSANFVLTDLGKDPLDTGTGRFYVGITADPVGFSIPVETKVDGLWVVIHSRYGEGDSFSVLESLSLGDGALVYVDGSTATLLDSWSWDSSVFAFDDGGYANLRSDRYGITMLASDLSFELQSNSAGYSLSIISTDNSVVLPGSISGTWADAGVTNDLDVAHAGVWSQATNNGLMVFDRVTVATVPEPTSVALALFGLAGVAFWQRRQRR